MVVVRWFLVAGAVALTGVMLLLRSELHGLIKREHPDVWVRKQALRWSGFSGESGAPMLLSFSRSQLAQLGNPEVDRLEELFSHLRVGYFVVLGLVVLSFLWKP
jgi:hypothetical protein